MTLEALATGAPMVVVVLADNQMATATELERLRLAVVGQGTDPEGVARAVVQLLADGERRRSLADRGPGLVDARGPARVAAAMRESLLVLRPATTADAERLLVWRNDPDTRAASFSTELVREDDHLAWLQRTLLRADEIVLIGEVAGQPVGVIRLNPQNDHATISVTVAPEARGAGIATPLIRAALAYAATVRITRVVAHIRPENGPSQRAFTAAGFLLTDEFEPEAPGAVVMVAS
jgi:RimJ/RimL family protein N-acetyltransferase